MILGNASQSMKCLTKSSSRKLCGDSTNLPRLVACKDAIVQCHDMNEIISTLTTKQGPYMQRMRSTLMVLISAWR